MIFHSIQRAGSPWPLPCISSARRSWQAGCGEHVFNPRTQELRQEHQTLKASLVHTGNLSLIPTKEEQPVRFTSHVDLGSWELGLHLSPLIQDSQEFNAGNTRCVGARGAVVITK